MAFEQFYLTEIGRRYFAKAIAGGTLKFTRAQVGDGFFPSDASIVETTALIHPIQTLGLTQISTYKGLTTIGTQFTNKTPSGSLLPPFWWAEAGLYAEIVNDIDCPPALVCYTNAMEQRFADYIPGTLTEFTFNWVINTSNAQNVEIHIDESLIYPTKSEFNEVYLVAYQALLKAEGDIDCGYFTDQDLNPVDQHNVDRNAHSNMAVDGNTASDV